MAETTANQTQQRNKQSDQAMAPREREGRGLRRQDRGFGSPFEFMDLMNEEMDRWFDRAFRDFGFPRRSWLSRPAFGSSPTPRVWSPRVDAFQKGDRFIVRAELPGMKKDEVQVELTDEALTIHGERHDERENEREGYYHSEREYGEFYRTIPLPEGVIAESAEAKFKDGVLEVTLQAPPAEANRGRRLEIKDASENPKK